MAAAISCALLARASAGLSGGGSEAGGGPASGARDGHGCVEYCRMDSLLLPASGGRFRSIGLHAQGSFDLLVGGDFDRKTGRMFRAALVLAEIETQGANRAAGHEPRDTRLAVRPVLFHFTRTHDREIFRIVEGRIIGGKLQPAGRIPVAARVHEIDAMPRIGDDFSVVMNLDLMFNFRIERLRRNDEHEIVAGIRDNAVSHRALLVHLRRDAVDLRFGRDHLSREVEGNGLTRVSEEPVSSWS